MCVWRDVCVYIDNAHRSCAEMHAATITRVCFGWSHCQLIISPMALSCNVGVHSYTDRLICTLATKKLLITDFILHERPWCISGDLSLKPIYWLSSTFWKSKTNLATIPNPATHRTPSAEARNGHYGQPGCHKTRLFLWFKHGAAYTLRYTHCNNYAKKNASILPG